MQAAPLIRIIALASAALALAACATTRPVHQWRNEAFSGSVDKILVIAAIDRSTQRRVYEDEFVGALKARGVTAVAGYTLITSSADITREAVENAIRGQDIEAVLVTRLLGVEDVEVYEPPVHLDYHRSYYRYYSHAMNETGPGYYRRYRVLTLESNLYDAASGELVWSMQSEAIEPSTPRHVIEEQIKLTIDNMHAQGLLAE
jgi:hypothetical protein